VPFLCLAWRPLPDGWGLLEYMAKGLGDHVVFGIPTLFAVITLVNRDLSLLGPSTSFESPRSGL
jgi:hypothetical protein